MMMMMMFGAGVDDNGERGNVPDCRACNVSGSSSTTRDNVFLGHSPRLLCVRACLSLSLSYVCDLYEMCTQRAYKHACCLLTLTVNIITRLCRLTSRQVEKNCKIYIYLLYRDLASLAPLILNTHTYTAIFFGIPPRQGAPIFALEKNNQSNGTWLSRLRDSQRNKIVLITSVDRRQL